MSENHMPEWAKPILESPINIMVGARKCLDVSTAHSLPACRDCPFYPWYDCYKILKEQLDELIKKEKTNGNAV